jgi:hypothetical protein
MSSLQSILRRLHFAETAAVDRMPAPEFSAHSSIDDVTPKWAPGVSRKQNGSAGNVSGRSFRGRWVQVSYAIIDVFLVSVNALIAFPLELV